MGWLSILFLISLLMPACSGVKTYTVKFSDGKELKVVMDTNRSPLGGTDFRAIQHWVYSPKTGEWTSQPIIGSYTEGKGLLEILKGVPIPIPIP
jgi:hypothetical protein